MIDGVMKTGMPVCFRVGILTGIKYEKKAGVTNRGGPSSSIGVVDGDVTPRTLGSYVVRHCWGNHL